VLVSRSAQPSRCTSTPCITTSLGALTSSEGPEVARDVILVQVRLRRARRSQKGDVDDVGRPETLRMACQELWFGLTQSSYWATLAPKDVGLAVGGLCARCGCEPALKRALRKETKE
jgi:hypothetical protein